MLSVLQSIMSPITVGLLIVLVVGASAALPPECPPAPTTYPEICQRIRLAYQCSVDEQDCSGGRICCIGMCGQGVCQDGGVSDDPEPAPVSCPDVRPWTASDCAAVSVGVFCSVERQDCASGQTCCSGFCGGTSCQSSNLPVQQLPQSCPPVVPFQPSDCATVFVVFECNTDLQDCPNGGTCCAGFCGSRTCHNPNPICPLYSCAPPPGGSCPNGVETDRNGCPTCNCRRVECLPRPCPSELANCRHGVKKDKDGCDTCECNCPVPLCLQTCRHGYRRDVSDCQTCECNCPLVKCSNFCPNGFAKDSSGCQTCQCDPGCPAVLCADPCGHGYTTNSKGCQTCECNCPLVRCSSSCPNGFAKDSSGCQSCQCAQGPTCPCGPKCCRLACPSGYARDENGCELCKCKAEVVATGSCPPVRNFPYRMCAFGLLRSRCSLEKQDCRSGMTCCKSICNTTRCFRSNSNTNTNVTCRKRKCRRTCPYGFRKSRRGCSTCLCNRRPAYKG